MATGGYIQNSKDGIQKTIYESDSSPTSWEFRSIPFLYQNGTIPEDCEIGPTLTPRYLETSIHLPRSRGSNGNGSRHSTGSSSSESQRSHDSGFLDSIEVIKKLQNRNGSTSSTGSIKHSCVQQCPITTPLSSKIETFINPKQLLTTSTGSTHVNTQTYSDSIYEDVIVASSIPNVICSLTSESLYPTLSHTGHLGTPACSSTPKKFHLRSDLEGFNKIDNFQSLNKNVNRSLDSNNNKKRYDSLPSGESIQKVCKTSMKSKSLANCIQPIPLVSIYSNNRRSFLNPTCPPQSSSQFHSFNSQFQQIPKGFKSMPVNNSLNNEKSKIIVKSHFDNDALRLWLHELRFQSQPETLCSLQVKSLRRSLHLKRSNPTSLSKPFILIKQIEEVASFLAEEYAFISKHLESGSYDVVPGLIIDLLNCIEDFLRDLGDVYGKLDKYEILLRAACYQVRFLLGGNLSNGFGHSNGCNFKETLNQMALDLDTPTTQNKSNFHRTSFLGEINLRNNSGNLANHSMRQNGQNQHLIVPEIVEGIIQIGNLVSQVVDERLRKELTSILDLISTGGLITRVSLQIFCTILYDGGLSMCRLASSIRTVRALLSATLDTCDEYDRVLCLRSLATILAIGEAVNDFDKAGGFEIITDILWDRNSGLQLKFEAVAVLTQATDPWIDLESTLCSLGIHLEKIIVSLTHLIPFAEETEDNFLLVMAALSNLTFLELASIEFLRVYKTIPTIINALEGKWEFSIFIKDHISTIFANMAGIENCRQEIVENHGVPVLVHFLNMCPARFKSQSEITSCERLQQKSTIALSRLASEEGVARMVLEMGGLERLIQLCRQDKQRNYSDGVLIACLATLRKLVSICGSDEVIQELGAEELIQPRLLDSFLLFSSRQESYV